MFEDIERSTDDPHDHTLRDHIERTHTHTHTLRENTHIYTQLNVHHSPTHIFSNKYNKHRMLLRGTRPISYLQRRRSRRRHHDFDESEGSGGGGSDCGDVVSV